MKLHRNLDSFFVVLLFVTVLLSPFWTGVKGQDWMRTYAPYVRFFLAISYIALGPWLMAYALKVRNSEEAVTIWSKTWPVAFGFGILSILGGAAALWTLLIPK